MIDTENQIEEKSVAINRIIGKLEGNTKGPTVVFFAGIHGNEMAGVYALQDVFKTINSENIKGNIYGISGNLKALQSNQRYIAEDLNRLWTTPQIEAIQSSEILNAEASELKILFKFLKEIIDTNFGPFYFFDLHTTSSKSLPFITINDALINRKFSKLFPVPIVLGIEEYLNGPLLSYINELGYVSLGFESGQHEDPKSITNTIAFIHLVTIFTGLIEKENATNFDTHYNLLTKEANQLSHIFEVVYLHEIKPKETFKMHNGFKSFQAVRKGEVLAISNNTEVASQHDALIFMPLYQKKGDDGFFIIKAIKPFYLKLSRILRRIRFDELLVFLPGITWINNEKGALMVDLKTARYLAKPFFHLLGYRNKQVDATHLRLYSREKEAKTSTYKKETWYRL